jgi:aerobic carbon-monoxide dehydrogenase large subunit
MGKERLLGSRVARVEDRRLITGAGRFVDDLRPADLLHAVFLRSHLAHARIVRIDTAAACKADGVALVATAQDFETLGSVPADPIDHDTRVPERRPLAAGRVRHVGDAVAMVVADSKEHARDALERIELDLEPLPVVVDPEAALAEGAPLLYPEFGTNLCFRQDVQTGDVEAAFKHADVVIRQRLLNQRVLPSPLEGRAILASWNGKRLTIEIPTQSPHLIRTEMAKALRLKAAEVRVIVRDFGGSFGCKGALYAEEIAVAEASHRLRRPVKWIEDRSEHCASTPHGRGQSQQVELAARKDGTILALRLRIVADLGAYLSEPGAHVPTGTPPVMTGCYRIPVAACTLMGVFTNTAPTGPYRGAGRPEAAYQIERMIDLLAQDLHRDPAELRRQNFIQPEEFPYTTAGGAVYDSGDYGAALDRLLQRAGYAELRRQQAASQAKGRLVGIGISTFVEMNGGGAADRCGIRMAADGRVTFFTGSAPHGQGHETAWAQVIADRLDLPFDQVRVSYGDTDRPGYTQGTWGSRSAPVSGSAAAAAAGTLINRLRRLGADALEASPDDIQLHDGRIQVAGAPSRAMTMRELGAWASEHGRLSELRVRESFQPLDFVYPFGAHLALVEVDHETGAVALNRYVAIDDCGVVINPMIVEGQVHGAVAQGIGQALFEGVAYDDDGQLLTGNLVSYCLPAAADLPGFDVDRTVTPTSRSILGAKGIAESGATGAPPAVVNAVLDALRPLGVTQLDMPLTPVRVWEAIHQASSRSKRSMIAGH